MGAGRAGTQFLYTIGVPFNVNVLKPHFELFGWFH